MEKRHVRQRAGSELGGIVERAQLFALDHFNQHSDARLVYHNYTQAIRTAQLVEEIGRAEEVDVEIPLLAAWMFNMGYLINYEQPILASVELAKAYLQQEQYPKENLEKVLNCIRGLRQNRQVREAEGKLFMDAIQAQQFGPLFFETAPLLQLELELVGQQYLSKADWTQYQLQQLLNVRYHTAFAKGQYEPLLSQHILQQRQLVEKFKHSPDDGSFRIFQQIERKQPAAGIQTFFRTNYRNHINLSAIADNKANIMISVNTILISVLITIISYKNITETNPMVLMPVIIFLITGLSSLIFAVLSARPKVTALNLPELDSAQKQKNIVFFGNFVTLELDEYEEAMDAMFRDSELLYGNMTRDLYYLGKVLDKKYRYLTISYNIFMLGFVATVITFMLALLT